MADTDRSSIPHGQARKDLPRAGRRTRKHRRTEKPLQGDNVAPRHLFDTLPFELIAEILLYTNSPGDVLAVARCNKFFCQTLVHPTSDYIWQSVRKVCPLPPPEPMSIFTEASYAAFLFGGGICEICEKYTDALYASFGPRFRLCDDFTCRSEFVMKGDYTQLNLFLPHDEKIKQCLPYAENNKCFIPNRLGRVYRESDAAREAIECIADPNGYLKKKQTQIAFTTKYMEFCISLDQWKKSRQKLYLEIARVNEKYSEQLTEKNGWVHWDLMSATPYGPMHSSKNKRLERVTQKDYDNIADEVKSTFARLAILRERKAREAAYADSRYAVEQHHQRLRSQQPHILLPSLEVFRRLPIVQLLQGTSPATVEFPVKDYPRDVSTTLCKEKWVVERLESQLRHWRERARRDLAAVLGYPSWVASTSNAVLHPVDRLTARFLCKSCSKVASRYREDGCLDFEGACAHFCPGRKKDKRVDGIWTAEHFVRDEKAITALENLLSICGTDASSPEATTFLESLNTTIECTTCGPGIVVNFRSLVGHSHRHEKMTMRVLSKEEIPNALLRPPQPSIVRSVTGSEPRFKVDRLQPIFGCRHCLISAKVAVETQPRRQLTSGDAESSPQPKLLLSSDTNAKRGVHKVKHVTKRFSFPGINSHLKEKHEILDVRDEDIFSFDHIQLYSKKK